MINSSVVLSRLRSAPLAKASDDGFVENTIPSPSEECKFERTAEDGRSFCSVRLDA